MAPLAIHLLHVLVFALFVAAPLPLGLCAVVLADCEEKRVSAPRALLILLVVWCASGAVVAHILATLHLLRFAAMVAAQALVFAGGVVCLRRLQAKRGALAWADRARAMSRPGGLETVALLTVAFMGLTLAWWSCAMPVVDWDSWAFHMPSMVRWLQSGTFIRQVQYSERLRHSYPYGWEALCTLFLTPFGEDMFVTFPNLVAWALLGVATHLLARLARARRIHALACAALLLAIPGIAGVVDTMHVDVPFAALFMAAAYLGVVFRRSGDRVALGLGAVSLGLACATRSTGPFYAVFLIAWLLLAPLGGGVRVASRPGRAARGVALAGIATGIALAGFWYAKNLFEMGHPFGAATLGEGTASAEGSWAYIVENTLAFNVNPLRLSSWKVLADRAFHELDVPFVAIVFLAMLWPASRIFGRRVPRGSAGAAIVMLVAGTGALLWVTPLGALSGIQLRLGFPFLAALAVAAAIGATRAGVRPEIPVALALLAASRTFGGSRVVYVLVALAILWGAWPRGAPAAGRGRVRALAAAFAVVLAITAITFAGLSRREGERREVYGPAYAYLEDHVDPGEAVAYLFSDRSYLFYGRRLARPVVYAPIGETASVADWAERLRRQDVRAVVVGPWSGDNAALRANLSRLMRPSGPLSAVSGRGEPGEVTVFRLDAAE